MEALILVVLSVIATGSLGAAGFLYLTKRNIQQKLSDKKFLSLTEEEAIEKASVKARNIILEAEKETEKLKTEAVEQIRKQRLELEAEEKRADGREKQLIERSKNLDERFERLETQERGVEQAKKDLRKVRDQLNSQFEKISNMTREEAKIELMRQTEEELRTQIAKKVKEAEYTIQNSVDEKAKELLVDAMQRSATDYVAETTATTIDIDNEELKGKIIGKEGRNIRTFEKLTGVDIIVDEAPNQVTLSCFDPIRREVGALALAKLLKDGRVHPGSIEETIKNIKVEVAKEIKRTGEKMAYDAGFPDLPVEMVKLLGRFKYRFSYGQNLVKHTLEMVSIGEALATEVGADINLVKKACLLHDLGKVLTHEIEGKPHHHISGDIVRKYLKDEVLANAVESHHGDIEPKSTEAVLVQVADAISGARPGARKDNYEDYVKRVKALEDIAKQYEQVHEAYAIHAGREVRVIFRPEKASDEDVIVLTRKIAKEIEETQNYPGSVKVTAIREFRVEEAAK